MEIYAILFLRILLIPSSTSIIDGFPANPLDILSQVSVLTRFSNGFTSMCGGVLIGPSVVLTAAHCVFVNDEFAITAKVTLGDYNLYEKDEKEQEFWSHAMAISKRFSSEDTNANDDVAVVFLPQRAEVCKSSVSAQIAKLPSTLSLNIGEPSNTLTKFKLENSLCYIAGWGKTENTSASYSSTARQMMVKLTMKRVGKYNHLLAKGISPNSRACMGDSGSPVYCYIEGKRTFVGSVAHIGSFSKMSSVSPMEHISFCRDFQYVFIADWRESSRRIVEILEKYGQSEQLEEGQEECFRSG